MNVKKNFGVYAIIQNFELSGKLEIHDVKPPVDMPAGYAFWAILAGIVLALLLGIWGYLRQRPTRVAPAPPAPPWEKALRDLEDLERENWIGQGKYKEYYSRLSDIIRWYMEERFQVKAPEMTTEEFLWSLEHSEKIVEQHREVLKIFLKSCDMVKFAKYSPTVTEAQESMRLAGRVIEETKMRDSGSKDLNPGS